MRQPQEKTSTGECRQCRGFCDKLVEPRGCMEMNCPFLYTYEEIATGRRFMGCMNKVFKAEIDLDMFLLTERTKPGYGGVKLSGQPLPQCQFTVEKSYEGDGPAYECVNQRFFDCDDDTPEGIRAFDLRNALT